MAFTRDKRATVTAAATGLLCLLAWPAAALTVMQPCQYEIRSGMTAWNGEAFGYPGSGFVSEDYTNETAETPAADGTYGLRPVPLPQLQGFSGFRVMDCTSGEFLAVNKNGVGAAQLLATEYLRGKVQQQKPFTLADVKRAANALYKGQDVGILTLRETEQTCACSEYGGQ